MATKNAAKEKVLEKLLDSLNYCNSHHSPVQPQFERIVDAEITHASCTHDSESRRRDMKALFPILLTSEYQGLIPSITIKKTALEYSPSQFLDLWLRKWVQKYVKEWEYLPSERMANQKQAVTDKALIEMVSTSDYARDTATAIEWAQHHNLFMSAENANGSLLEEYIASKIEQYGWIWCRGKIVTAIDFCNHDCTQMFQVKNKTNTENSSGKGFRESRGAAVWCRLHAKRKAGKIVTYWPDLIELIREGSNDQQIPEDIMCEEEYLAFIRQVIEKNPQRITWDEA